MKHYLRTAADTVSELESQLTGLSAAEAAKRLARDGRNKLDEGKKITLVQRFIEQLVNPMVLVLIAAAAISALTSAISKEAPTDVFVIMAVVLLNTILGVVQESKAEKAIEALRELASPTSKVIRDGKLTVVKTEEIVVGDIVVLDTGDSVPADGRIIECASMKCDEAALTGESVPVEKTSDPLESKGSGDVPLGDRVNMVYMGSTVVYGRGRFVVTATGMNTEMGKIADVLTRTVEDDTPLQKKLSSLSKILTYLVLGICLFIFVIGMFKTGGFTRDSMLQSFMLAVSLAVAAIPEGLAAVVTIVLSMGVTKMSRRNAIIRKLTAVETLGCTQVICSDKTGTLTQNKMTVVEHVSSDEKLLATSLALCSDSELNEQGIAEGDPTQNACVNFAMTLGMPKPQLKAEFPRVAEIPFDSMRKMMTTVHKTSGGKVIQHTTGAPDVIIDRCNRYLEGGKIMPMTEEKRAYFKSENKRMASKALRVLAASYTELPSAPPKVEPQEMERDLIFIGLVGMMDPVREEVPAAIQRCREAGIRPIMITGDHRDTAAAIAKQLGIIANDDEAITGTELDAISDEDFRELVTHYSVYARVKPEHKVRIVNAWRARGMVTAMTGDGVNDAPSIKSADIGVGMGITGTDVTKNVADMILADDNFATIVTAVEEGRRVYDNIRKAIQFLLSSNLSEVIGIFVATLIGFMLLRPIHILFINLITDSLPALALGMEKSEPDIMRRPPRDSNEGIFAHGVGISVMYQGIAVSILTLVAYFVGHYIESGVWEIANSADGMTMAFLTMSMAEIFHSYNMRSHKNSIFTLGTHNYYLFGAMAMSLVLTTTVIYVPFLRELFSFEVIDAREYFIALGLAFLIIPIVEIVKIFHRLYDRRAAQKSNKSA